MIKFVGWSFVTVGAILFFAAIYISASNKIPDGYAVPCVIFCVLLLLGGKYALASHERSTLMEE